MNKVIYIDTCIISGYIRQDLKSSDQNALEKIINEKQDLSFCSSTIASQELNKINPKYVAPHKNYSGC